MKIKGLGLRNIKTAFVVFICIVTANIFQDVGFISVNGFYASVAGVITIQSNLLSSFEFGMHRIYGTLIGGIISFILYYLTLNINFLHSNAVVAFIAIIIGIYICNILRVSKGVPVCCIMVIATFTMLATNVPLYIIIRVVETSFGVVVAIIVNRFIFPPSLN